MREQQPNDYNPQQFQDLFYKIIQTFPQFDTMQKSLSTNELSPEKSAQDLTVNRGQYDLNASDFNCSNTTLGTLPSPSEKSSPHDSSLCHSQHTSTEMKKHQTDYQQLNHQQEKDDKAVRHATECQNKLFSCIINDERERRKHASSQRNAFHFSSVNNTRDNISPLDAAIQYEKSPNSIRNIDIDTVESYKLHTKELAQNYHCHYHHCQKNNESSADEYHAINLSMKENNLSKTKLPYQPDISEHNIQANDQSLFNSKLHEYYTKLLQINYFEWLRYLLCQPLRVSGNPSASSPIPSLSHINNDYYSINDKFHDVSNMNNINHILVGDQCSTDPQTTDLQSVHLSSTNSSVNSDIFGTNYSNDLSYYIKLYSPTFYRIFISLLYGIVFQKTYQRHLPACH
ncbi:unnamed protein product [Heterobilharzia americana]|nr:unnamed protein product [Heterobilharzia americana]